MKKLDKRACRKYFDPGLQFDRGNGLLLAKEYDYIVRTAVKNIGGRRVLLLYIYSREELKTGAAAPMFTIFSTKEDDAVLARGTDGKLRWRQGDLDCLLYYDCKTHHYAFYSKRDAETVNRYFHCEDSQGMTAFSKGQHAIREKRAKQRAIRTEKKVVQELACFPKPSQKEKRWLNNLLPQYLFYDYNGRKPPEHCFCMACSHSVELPAAKHNQHGICPRCRREVIFKSRGKQKRIWDRYTAQFLRRLDDHRLGISVWKVERIIRDGSVHDHTRESARYTVDLDNGFLIQDYYDSYWKGYTTTWKRGMRPQFSYWQYNYEGDANGILYPGNLDEVLCDTPWKYSQIGSFSKEYGAMKVLPYLRCYLCLPQLEYLVKLGLTRLAAHYVYCVGEGYRLNFSDPLYLNTKSVDRVLKVPKRLVPFVLSLNPDENEVRFIQKVAALQPDRDFEPAVRWCIEHGITEPDVYLSAKRYMTFHQWSRYLAEQNPIWWKHAYSRPQDQSNYSQVALAYRDYLNLSEKLEKDMKNSFVLFPKDLKLRHDQSVELYRKKKDEINDKRVAMQFESKTKLYAFSDDALLVLPPHSAQEISKEGDALHHCVGTYAERVADGETDILFVRKQEEPDKPYCTVEVRNGEVKQSRCYRNSDPPAEVQQFIRRWMMVVHQRMTTQVEEPEEILAAA